MQYSKHNNFYAASRFQFLSQTHTILAFMNEPSRTTLAAKSYGQVFCQNYHTYLQLKVKTCEISSTNVLC